MVQGNNEHGKDTKINVGKVILTVIAVAGVVGIALVAPNALQAFDRLFRDKKRKYHASSYIKKKITQLVNQNLIEIIEKNGKRFARLTPQGYQKLLRYRLGELTIEKPKKWDGKWRVIIFDIQEKRRRLRDALRNELAHLGFLSLQKSVWVHPYECEEVIILLKSHFHVGKDILYMTVEKIENDTWLKREFELI